MLEIPGGFPNEAVSNSDTGDATLSVCLAVGACGTSSSGASTPSTHSTATAGPAATATLAANQPTSVPVASVAECGQLLSISQANQFTNPVSPATSIAALDVGGSECYYETTLHQTNVAMVFKPYTGGSLSQNVQKAVSGSVSGVKIISSQSVSGVGNQALYVTITGTSTSNGVTVPIKENILFVVDGAVSYGIINIIFNTLDPLGSASAATVLGDFEQVAQVVDSHL